MGGASTTVNFNDTSEYMFRNSSTQKGGFEGNIGHTDTDIDIATSGTEDVEKLAVLLTDADRTKLRTQIETLEACAVATFCSDKASLVEHALAAWQRALTFYPEFRALLEAELVDVRAETMNAILMYETQWARIAGSSLNCLVAEMSVKAQVELGRRISGIVAEQLRRAKEHETDALKNAFEKEFSARARVTEVGISGINSFWQVLRGAEVTEVTDRDYTEARNEDQRVTNLLGKFYHEGIDIADSDGAYALAGDAVSASQGIAGIIT